MSNQCERCGRQYQVLTGSWFNTQMICPQCRQLETEHPLYEKAKRVENEHCFNGNYNFEGIGLPKDLEIVSRIADDIDLENKPQFQQPLNKKEEKKMISFLNLYK